FAAPDQTAIINVDDEYGKRLYDELHGRKRVSISFREKTADCFVSNVIMCAAGTTFDMILDGRTYGLKIRLTGLHNVCNLVCALLAARSTGLALEDLIRAAETAPPAPGRLESFPLPNGAHAFVDYAHTDDAILRVTAALYTLKTENGRLITVFGCGGDRDRTKRPRMGRAATENSDHTIVTSDNPRTEDPLQIIADILPGIPEGAPYEVEPDRAKAIAKALAMTEKNDIVLIAGKGHEDYQDIMGVKHHFDDREEVQKFIAQHH
ncbi:MAG: UDP-N-acetylmuramoyl-L-alanyl-D-glutamate--2,6-diaminopimelate ligase, partial [Lentisphaeria bacterium]|nr:UDP-N-acetylmuramoyl-L-alanyl-D-glutamate--2,6-diaminopimelate ligase [Lentisphaeria bacterium]